MVKVQIYSNALRALNFCLFYSFRCRSSYFNLFYFHCWFIIIFIISSNWPALPGVPADLSAVHVTGTSIRLSWRSPSETLQAPRSLHVPPIDPTLSYVVLYGERDIPEYSLEISPVLTTDYTVTGLLAGTTYSFRVMAINSVGQGTPCDSLDVTTLELSQFILIY